MSGSSSESKCRVCGHAIEPGACKCPNCGTYRTRGARVSFNLVWLVVVAAVVVSAAVFSWQQDRRNAAKLEEIQRNSAATALKVERELTEQIRQLQASVDAISSRLRTPIDIQVTGDEISLNCVTLSAYLHDYLRTPRTRRAMMQLSLVPPDLLALLRERANAHLETPGLSHSERERVQNGMDYASRLWEKMGGSVNDLIEQAAELITEPEGPTNHRKPGQSRVSGSSQQAAFSHPEAVRKTGDENQAVERIAAICDNYIRIQMYQCLHTLATLLPAAEVADLDNLPPVVTREDTWESLVRSIYREKGLKDRHDNPLAAVQLTSPGMGKAELFFPRDIGPVDLVKFVREQPYLYLGSTVDVSAHISRDDWADHALWQMLSRYEMMPGFRMAWRPSDFSMILQP